MISAEDSNKITSPVQCPCCLAEHTSFFLCKAGKDKKYSQYECSRCGFQFTWPCPSEEEIDRFYAEENYYTSSNEKDDPGDYQDYDHQVKGTLEYFRGWLKSFAFPEKATMLDVGCAKGRFMELAKKEFHLECTGIELSDYARQYVKDYYSGAFPVWKSLDEMPVPERAFDLIILFDVIEHVNDPWILLLGLFKRGCVGEHTRILITTPNCSNLEAMQDPGAWQYRYPPAHLSFCSPATFQKISEILLFRNAEIFGHSMTDGSMEGLEGLMQQTYSGFDGLCCCFSGSILCQITPDRFPASLAELKKLPEYAALLSDYILKRKNSPFNPAFRDHLVYSFSQLAPYKTRYEELVQQYATLEKGWREGQAWNEELTSNCSRLESEWKDVHKRYEELVQQYATLEKGWREGQVKNEELMQQYATLEKGWREGQERNEELMQQYATLEKGWREGQTRNEELMQQYATLEKGWREGQERNEELMQQCATLEKEWSESQTRNEELTSRLSHLESEKKDTDNKLRQAISERDTLLQEIEQANGKCYSLWLKITEMIAQLEQADADKAALRNQLCELNSYKEHLENQVRELSSYKDHLENQVRELSSYKDHLENQVRELGSYKDHLENQVRELSSCKDHLENQLRELSSYKDHLENQVRELSSYKDHLENQVRELSSYKDHLENQVRELSEKLNEVYHSNSYRIGTMITWPIRKYKAVIASMRQLKKEYGSSFMWKCIFRKLTCRKVRHFYDIVSSIGVNCEISYHLVRKNGFVESYPLIWSLVRTLKNLPELIKNPEMLSDDQEVKHDYSCNMVRYPDVDISFHCKNHVESLLGSDGEVDEKKAQAERDELKSRLGYLAKKWKRDLTDPERKMLCILTPWEDSSTTEEILAIHDALKTYPAVDLLVVLTGKEKSVSSSKLRKAGIFIRHISHHPPHNKVTDKEANDLAGWDRICYEFQVLNKKVSNKVYKYEH